MSEAPTFVQRLQPDLDDAVDLGFAFVLSCLAVLGFRSSFGGGEELTIGVPAAIAGLVLGYVLAKARLQMLVVAGLATVAFFLLGGVLALRDEAAAGFIPTPQVWVGLIDGCINGWVRLITSVPPAPSVGNLLAIPYLAGFAGALLAVLAAYAWPRLPVCVLPPAVVLAVTVLLGVEDPVSLLLQGALFGALVVAWLSLRVRRTEPGLVAGGRRRALSGVAMLGLVAIGALFIGPSVPGASANERYILREKISPPFDPSQYPSPLARYRKYHGEEPIKEVLFTVEGVPAGEVVRFAVVDDYDGFVWRASPPGTSVGGAYQRVGDHIPGAASGEKATLRFEMGALASSDAVWIPTAGSPTSITFDGDRSEILTEEFRFNRITETAASPVPLVEGDTWSVETVFPGVEDEDRLRELPTMDSASVPAPAGQTDTISSRLAEWTADATDPYSKVFELEEKLKDIGAYNDGDEIPVPAGHGLARLVPFLEADQPQGNGEQYAAAVAFAARSLGIPARVVVEFDPPDGEGAVEVMADDARTTVEIALAEVGWVAVGEPTPSEDDKPEQSVSNLETTTENEVQPPPPTTVPPPNSLLEDRLQDREVDFDDDTAASGSGLLRRLLRLVAIGSIPLLVVLLPVAAVLMLKRRRRRRRRLSGSPQQRIAAGWSEVIDLARDAGNPAPATSTRREWARLLPAGSVVTLAGEADRWTFGDAAPSEPDVDGVWNIVDKVRAELSDPLSRWERIRAAISLTSLRAVR